MHRSCVSRRPKTDDIPRFVDFRGCTNGQVGTGLFISTRTASVHASNILRKLGVTNRVEAADIAAQRQPKTLDISARNR